jgi:hypothetical protein
MSAPVGFSIDIDLRPFTEGLDELQQRQLPFALARGLNVLAKEGQANVRRGLSDHFTINEGRRSFVERMVRISREDWARKDHLAVRIGVNQSESGSGKDRSFILGRHEEGGIRTADPSRPFFIPTNEIRPGAYDVVPRSLYPSSLRLFERRTPNGLLPALDKGKRKTFIIDARATADARSWGVFQRTGSGPRDIRMLWAFRTKIQLSPRLGFYRTFEDTINARMMEVMHASIEQALATAK